MKLAAFTLLEVMLAVAILALISVTIYRFTETTLQAAGATARDAAAQQACTGLTHLLQAQFDALPAGIPGALAGGSRKVNDHATDELTLICDSPNALLARGADAPWRVGFSLRPGPVAGRNTLGLARLSPVADPTANNLLPATDSADPAAPAAEGASWTPLLENVASLEFNYFNARLNGWVPKWNDPNALPDLVRVRLGFSDGRPPFEAVLRVPPRARQLVVLPLNPAAGGGGANTPATPGAAGPAPPHPARGRR